MTQFSDNNTDEQVDFTSKMKRAIDVQRIDTNLYMSKELWLPYGARGVFGGQIVAQSLRAAWDTVPDDFFVHSLHAYFILACNADIPVIYNVQRIRDGKSFATRIVKATQKGKAIYVCSFSFSKLDEGISLNHQTDMPDVADPDTLSSDYELLRDALQNPGNYPERVLRRAQDRLTDSEPIIYKPVNTYTDEEIVTGDVKPDPIQRRWFKTKGRLDDDMKLHTCIIAYASDAGFVNTAARAHGLTYNSQYLTMMASLDHAVWFHAPARADEWLLYDIHSPRAISSRGMAFGRIYSQDGTLIATAAQEGIIRLSDEKYKQLEEAQNQLKQELANNLSRL